MRVHISMKIPYRQYVLKVLFSNLTTIMSKKLIMAKNEKILISILLVITIQQLVDYEDIPINNKTKNLQHAILQFNDLLFCFKYTYTF